MSGLNIKLRIRLIDRGIAQPGRAVVSNTTCRGFDPYCPCHTNSLILRLFFIDKNNLMAYYGVRKLVWKQAKNKWCGNCGG